MLIQKLSLVRNSHTNWSLNMSLELAGRRDGRKKEKVSCCVRLLKEFLSDSSIHGEKFNLKLYYNSKLFFLYKVWNICPTKVDIGLKSSSGCSFSYSRSPSLRICSMTASVSGMLHQLSSPPRKSSWTSGKFHFRPSQFVRGSTLHW